MKSCALRFCLILLVLISPAWAQWSSNPAANTLLAGGTGDQVQPKILPLSNGNWYLSWFDGTATPPPAGYKVYAQAIDAGGVALGPSNGGLVANLGLSSTEDYGLSVDTANNELIAFQDDREGSNVQITAVKISPAGQMLWGPNGIQLTNDQNSNNSPKIAGTSDGDVVVAWTSNSNVVLQKLDPSGSPLWGSGIVLSASKTNFELADLHAADSGSVIVSFVSSAGFGSPSTLLANKLSATGQLLWGSQNLVIYNAGSLQFGEFPYFVPDGNGGAVFAWYSNSPALQVFAQHILSNGSAAFPQNGAPGATGGTDVRVSPSVSYDASTGETFLFWTEQDSNQIFGGVSGQKFDSAGNPQWGTSGLVIVPLNNDQELWVENVQRADGALVFWVDEASFGNDVINAAQLSGAGQFTCSIFPVSTSTASKSRLVASQAASGQATVVWQDNPNDEQDNILIQDVNPDCSLGYPPIQCSDLTGAHSRCQNGNLQIEIGLNDRSFDGDQLGVQINGTNYSPRIRGLNARISVPGQGSNTVLLTNPSGCVAQKTLQCP
ncbi:MAG TPA: hypothetical protein VMB18_05010 [Terriglobales bacterium]|nr:hypothetical protein [Terriglobales bacterium]